MGDGRAGAGPSCRGDGGQHVACVHLTIICVVECNIEISGNNIKTLAHGTIYRLGPEGQVTVDVLVSGVRDGDVASVFIKSVDGETIGQSQEVPP